VTNVLNYIIVTILSKIFQIPERPYMWNLQQNDMHKSFSSMIFKIISVNSKDKNSSETEQHLTMMKKYA